MGQGAWSTGERQSGFLSCHIHTPEEDLRLPAAWSAPFLQGLLLLPGTKSVRSAHKLVGQNALRVKRGHDVVGRGWSQTML